jgi:hypothetical protein
VNGHAGTIGMKFNHVPNRTSDSDARHESVCGQDLTSKSFKLKDGEGISSQLNSNEPANQGWEYPHTQQ